MATVNNPTLNASVDTKMDHSCNWKCCWGCKKVVIKKSGKAHQRPNNHHDGSADEVTTEKIHRTTYKHFHGNQARKRTSPASTYASA